MDIEKLPPWPYNDYSDFAEEVEEEDNEIERPPLIGKSFKVPEGLYDQPWDNVMDAYGEAHLTPYYIEALGSDNDGDVQFASYGLYSATTHQGSVYEASKMAIPYLIEMLEADLAPHFLSRIAVGEDHFINSPRDLHIAQSRPYFRDVYAYRNTLLDYYNRTSNEELVRLLCFFPYVLPDILTLPDEDVPLASTLVAQGFIAAERGIKIPEAEIRKLMEESPSLLVRGAAAICLAYAGYKDIDVASLLEYLAQQEFFYTPWVWSSLERMALATWLYIADLDTLLEGNTPIPLGSRLVEAVERYFLKYHKEPYHPSEITPIQHRILEKIADKSPDTLRDFNLLDYGLPINEKALNRLLERSNTILDTKVPVEPMQIEGYPLWYILEKTVFQSGLFSDEVAVRALSTVDVWTASYEVFEHIHPDKQEERCTLSIHNQFSDKRETQELARLISIFSNALSIDDIKNKAIPFLDEWLEKVKSLDDGYDLAFKTPAFHISIALLAIGRRGMINEKYYPLICPYHKYYRFSRMPLPVLSELLTYTSPAHQKSVVRDLALYELSDESYTIHYEAWELLKGCKGNWVTESVRESVLAHNKAKSKSEILKYVFPYQIAATILMKQDGADYNFIYSLPRY